MSYADEHRDWHTVANAEGVNPWDCPFDCYADMENGPTPYATVWYLVPGQESSGERGYIVYSRGQMERFATVAAQRTNKVVRVEMAR